MKKNLATVENADLVALINQVKTTQINHALAVMVAAALSAKTKTTY